MQLKGLLMLFARQPLMCYPTMKATLDCLRISDRFFPKLHHINNPTNAFRHALWNMLLMKESLRWNSNIEKADAWAEKITSWHEDFSPNPPLERAMDLHNNAFGRRVFNTWHRQGVSLEVQGMITYLREETEKSKKVTTVEEIFNFNTSLVYIKDL